MTKLIDPGAAARLAERASLGKMLFPILVDVTLRSSVEERLLARDPKMTGLPRNRAEARRYLRAAGPHLTHFRLR